MKITFKTSGGFAYFPELEKPIIINMEEIDPQVAAQLEAFVRESHFFDLPTSYDATPAKGAADYLTYTITVEDGLRVHSVQLTDPIKEENLEQFVKQLQTITRPSSS